MFRYKFHSKHYILRFDLRNVSNDRNG